MVPPVGARSPLDIFSSSLPFSAIEKALREAEVPAYSDQIRIDCSLSEKEPIYIIDNNSATPARFATVDLDVAWCHITFMRITSSLELIEPKKAKGVHIDIVERTNWEKIKRMRCIMCAATGLMQYRSVQMLVSLLKTLRVWPQSIHISIVSEQNSQHSTTAKANEFPPTDPGPFSYSSVPCEAFTITPPSDRSDRRPSNRRILSSLEMTIKKNQAALQAAKFSLLHVTKARFCTPHHIFSSRWVRLRREIRVRETRDVELKWRKGVLMGRQEDLHSFFVTHNTKIPKGIANMMQDVCRE